MLRTRVVGRTILQRIRHHHELDPVVHRWRQYTSSASVQWQEMRRPDPPYPLPPEESPKLTEEGESELDAISGEGHWARYDEDHKFDHTEYSMPRDEMRKEMLNYAPNMDYGTETSKLLLETASRACHEGKQRRAFLEEIERKAFEHDGKVKDTWMKEPTMKDNNVR